MTVSFAIALYLMIWWTMLFAVLPFGIKSQAESGDVQEGTDPGAPVAPGLLKKALITSLASAATLAIVIAAMRFIEL
jgi:predicted secreted protein